MLVEDAVLESTKLVAHDKVAPKTQVIAISPCGTLRATTSACPAVACVRLRAGVSSLQGGGIL